MSNYLSQEYKVANPPQLGDVDLARSVMSTLQGRYDTNKALIDQTLNAYNANLKGLRPEDNSYIASRLQQVKTTIDQYSLKNGNLAYSNNSNSILSAITSLMDDPLIQDAITSKQNYTNLISDYQKRLEKNDGSANEANLNYALYKGGYQDYMQGKTNKLGSMQYTPYVDLREKHLKDLKTIKDLKGKRFIETPDGKGGVIRKEIDGLTDDEVRSMFEGQLSPQEQQQIAINGWSKYAQPNTIEPARQMYGQYVGQLIKNKEQNLVYYEAQSKNSNLGEDVKEDNRRKYEQLNAEIENYKTIDISKLDAETIAYNLEKAGYINNISQIASTEWSTSLEKDDVYFANQDLEIKRANLEISRGNQEIARLRLAKELGIDVNGNPIAEEQVYQSSIDTELQKEMEEEGVGYANLNKQHGQEVTAILDKSNRFLQNASDEDRAAYIANLKKRGLDESLNWIEGADMSKGKSTAVYEAFQEGNFASTYAEYDMSAENERKRMLSKNISDVNRDATLPIFKQDPDKYINFLRRAERELDPQFYVVSDVVGNENAKKLSTDIKTFVNQAGGWGNIKSYLTNNPNKLAEFAELTDKADRTYKGITPFLKAATVFGAYDMGGFIDQNLKEDAKQRREEIIQQKTQQGTVMSSYNAFNFAQPDTREKILRMIPNERVVGSNGVLDRSKNANLTAYKQGDNIVLTQEQKGKDNSVNVLRVVLDQGDAAYNEINKYIDLTPKANNIKVDKNFSLTPAKVNLGSFSNNSDITKKRQYSIQSTFRKDQNLLAPFQSLNASFGVRPDHYATKETALLAVTGVLKAKGIPDEKVQVFTDKLFANLNTYRAHTKATNNITATGYKPVIEYKNPQGKSIESIDLGDNLTEVNKELLYLINNHPQIFLLNQLLFETNGNNIDEKINSL